MPKLTCNCLNVSLNIDEGGSEATDGGKLLGQEPENRKNLDEFFQKEILLVSLAFAGIEVQQNLLIKEREVGDYKVFKCINCEMSTHAIHKFKGLERVVASKELIDSSSFSKLRESSDYSPVFKIVLKPIKNLTTNGEENVGQAKMFHKSLSETNSKVHEIVKKFLIVEEEAMQERIRIFTEQQQEMFRKLQRKITTNKDIFLRLMNKKEEHALETSLTDAMNDSVLTKSSSIDSESEDTAPDLPQIIKGKKTRPNRFFANNSTHDASGSLPNHLPPSRVLSSHDNGKKSSSNKNQSSQPVLTNRNRRWKSYDDEDALFDLDGFQETKSCEPFFESDEESSGDSNSLDSSGGYTIPNRGTSGERIYATSVPVGIPMFHTARKESFEDEDDMGTNGAPSPGKIAESMKALARSLYDSHSTSIFGELPTPRYNTMPHK